MAYMVATESFHTATKKGTVSIKEGQTLPDTDPLVRANPDKFVPQDEWLEGQSKVFSYVAAVESATAAPGEVRAVKKPRKVKAAK